MPNPYDHSHAEAPMLGSGTILLLAAFAFILFVLMGGGCAHNSGRAGVPSCAELAGVDPMSERVEPVWIRNTSPGAKSPAYVLGGVRIVSTNEVIPTLPHTGCGRYVAPPPNGVQIF